MGVNKQKSEIIGLLWLVWYNCCLPFLSLCKILAKCRIDWGWCKAAFRENFWYFLILFSFFYTAIDLCSPKALKILQLFRKIKGYRKSGIENKNNIERAFRSWTRVNLFLSKTSNHFLCNICCILFVEEHLFIIKRR